MADEKAGAEKFAGSSLSRAGSTAGDATKVLSPEAQRALAEAVARRAAAEAGAPTLEKERGGRKEGLEPTRYGDWEKKGILSDF